MTRRVGLLLAVPLDACAHDRALFLELELVFQLSAKLLLALLVGEDGRRG